MHPVLFEISGVPITAYGAALGLSFALGIALAMRRAPAAGLDPDIMLEAGIVALFSSLLGSRLLFALENPAAFTPPEGQLLDLLRPMPGEGMKGLSMSLGVLLGVGSVLGWLRLRGQPVLRAADLMAPSVALGEALTRFGCFFNGCCHGVVCDWPWGVRFPDGSFAYRSLGDVSVHPTQLYTSAGAAAICVFLLWLTPRVRRPGIVFFAFLALWAGSRLSIDLLRYYPADLTVASPLGLAVVKHQVFVGLLLLIGAVGLLWLRRSEAAEDSPG